MLFSTQVYFFSFFLFSNQWPHCILGGQLLFELFTTTSFHPQSKFISCYDITVELQRLEELYAGRETEEKLRSKWNPEEGSSFHACVPVLNKMQCHLCGTTHPLKLLEKCFWHFWVADLMSFQAFAEILKMTLVSDPVPLSDHGHPELNESGWCNRSWSSQLGRILKLNPHRWLWCHLSFII